MRPTIVREDYIRNIEKFIDKPFIKVITGIRRCGKSTILRMLRDRLIAKGVDKNNIIVINKESFEFDSIVDYKDLHNFVTAALSKVSGLKYLFVDEIQEIKQWEKAIASFFSDNEIDIVITGSNARLLSSELATLLSGRYVEIPIFPLTFKEFLLFRGCAIDSPERENEFDKFLRYGGMPAIHTLDLEDETVFQYLSALFNTIFLRDVIARHTIRDIAHIELVARFLFDNCGNITTVKRIADYFKGQNIAVSPTTVQNYLSYFEEAFLAQRVRRFDMKGLKHLEFYEKYYMGDIGLRHGLIGFRDKDISGLLENIVYLELKYRGYAVSVGRYDDKEIDFIAEKQNEKLFVQVSYLMSSPETIEREFGALEKIPSHYPKMVLSLDRHFPSDRNGITHKNLIQFLLS